MSTNRLRESAALARQGLLIARRWVRGESATPNDARRHVIFVHGYLAAGAVFDPLRAHVEDRADHATVDFGYGPHRAFESVGEELAELVQRVGRTNPVVLVGHSLGGLLARWCVDVLENAQEVERIVTLATPHGGTERARIAPGSLGAALRPGSAVLRRLGEHSSVPLVSIAGSADRVVPVSSASAVRNAQMHVIPGVGHNGLLYERRAYDVVVHALRSDDGPAVAAE